MCQMYIFIRIPFAMTILQLANCSRITSKFRYGRSSSVALNALNGERNNKYIDIFDRVITRSPRYRVL